MYRYIYQIQLLVHGIGKSAVAIMLLGIAPVFSFGLNYLTCRALFQFGKLAHRDVVRARCESSISLSVFSKKRSILESVKSQGQGRTIFA